MAKIRVGCTVNLSIATPNIDTFESNTKISYTNNLLELVAQTPLIVADVYNTHNSMSDRSNQNSHE